MKKEIALLFAITVMASFTASASEEMITYADLSVSSSGADGYSYAYFPCGCGWVLSSDLTLYRDFTVVDFRHGQSFWMGQSVWLSVGIAESPPPYTLYRLEAETEGEISDYGWFWAFDTDEGMTPGPSVTISVEQGKQQLGVGFVLQLSTTNLSANGSPSGGTYEWSIGPKMVFADSPYSENTAVEGREESSSKGDTWVQVTYTVGGYTATASVRFTVRRARELYADSLGGPSRTTYIRDSNQNIIGYLTNITYRVRDQFGATIELEGIAVSETLRTIYQSHPVQFDPPDGVEWPGSSSSDGSVFDYLSVGPLQSPIPADLQISRGQRWKLQGWMLQPEQEQRYHPSYAEILYRVLISW